MTIPIYQVDAFADKPFTGNPAGVCILERPATDAWMQSVAMEMNLSETAFVMRRADGDFDLRWFTPAVEVSLCGHATLATSHVLYESGFLQPSEIARYHTKSGLLQARFVDGLIELDFPASDMETCDAPEGLSEALGLESKLWRKRPTRPSYLIEVASEAIVRNLTPNFAALRLLGIRSVMVTARAETGEFDFISRFFAPGVGVNEDPVTGSAHCTLAPYWGAKLGKTTLSAYQASTRGGSLLCTLEGDRVKLAGKALTILRGELFV